MIWSRTSSLRHRTMDML
ncbi:TPA: hypothetical protein N0F65_004291 [Lagenidium giganteum]|uniref:Uncharacterized protein n=1 Tax=Lagenidium giganteum TaxID=4803 RepID=A0AAV2Z9T1_9STRA|nr:TPA: hypothetical protein N0F65_004291 [Lagenidium giganteum]